MKSPCSSKHWTYSFTPLKLNRCLHWGPLNPSFRILLPLFLPICLKWFQQSFSFCSKEVLNVLYIRISSKVNCKKGKCLHSEDFFQIELQACSIKHPHNLLLQLSQALKVNAYSTREFIRPFLFFFSFFFLFFKHILPKHGELACKTVWDLQEDLMSSSSLP